MPGQLTAEHLERAQHITSGAVRVPNVMAAILAHRSREIAGLVVVVDLQRVDHAATLKIEGDPGAPEFLLENRQIETCDAEAGEITTIEKQGDGRGVSGERRKAGEVVAGQTVRGGGARCDRRLRIDAALPEFRLAGRLDSKNSDFDDARGTRVTIGGLEIKHGEGALDLERACERAPKRGEMIAIHRPALHSNCSHRSGWRWVHITPDATRSDRATDTLDDHARAVVARGVDARGYAHVISACRPTVRLRGGGVDAIILVPDGPKKFATARPRLRRGSWGDGASSLCLVAALVPGARNFGDCVDPWPEWLPMLCAALYDATTGSADEQASADAWAERLALMLSRPIRYDRAGQMVLLGLLATIAPLDESGIAERARSLLDRRSRGESVEAELRRTAAAARTAATSSWGSVGLLAIPQERMERRRIQPAAWSAAAAAASAIAGAICATAASAADFSMRRSDSDRGWQLARREQREVLLAALSGATDHGAAT